MGIEKKKKVQRYSFIILSFFERHKMCESTMESAHFVVHVSVWESNVNL